MTLVCAMVSVHNLATDAVMLLLWQSETDMLFFHCGSNLFSACRFEVCKSISLSQESLVDFQPHALRCR